MTFPFENLNVYKKAMHFVDEIEKITLSYKNKINYSYLDQLSRASLSIPLNIAEGNGRWHKGDKKQFFWIARGSAFECIPLLQIFNRKKLISDQVYKNLYGELEEISKMLSGLIASVDDLNHK